MSKSELTLQLERLIWEYNSKNGHSKIGTYGCHEVGIGRKRLKHGIVDYLTYTEKDNIWKCYEIKISKSDFYSKAKHTFVGQYNYFVMPKELYEEVKNDIPNEIGVFIPDGRISELYSIKKAKKKKMGTTTDVLIYSLIKSLSREHDKVMRGR